jgi:hypothetical protein
MARYDLLSIYRYPWTDMVRSEQLGVVDPGPQWAFETARHLAVFTPDGLADLARGSNWRKNKSEWRSEVSALSYAYLLPEVLEQRGCLQLLDARMKERIGQALGPSGRYVLEPEDHTTRMVRASDRIVEAMSRHGFRKLGEPLKFSLQLAAATAGARAMLSHLIATASYPAPPANPVRLVDSRPTHPGPPHRRSDQASPPPPAGWYHDPPGSRGFRYWDGSKWTEHVRAE